MRIYPSIFYLLFFTVFACLFFVFVQVAEIARKVSYIHTQIADLHATVNTTHEIINPSPISFDEEEVSTQIADFHDEEPAIDVPDSDVQNMELNERVAMLKEQIARTTASVKSFSSPPSITPLHPDVYNIPHDDIYQPPNMIEYVK